MALSLYWITLKVEGLSIFGQGCGVTACSREDAVAIFAEHIVDMWYEIVHIEPIFDVSTLDRNHVLPNMGNIFVRGIWFPKT